MAQHAGDRSAPPRSLAAALAEPSLRIPLTYLVVAQLLDVITTVVGLVCGLAETNPVAVGFLERFGLAGLLIQKLAIVAAVALAVSLLPRRLAGVACWAFVAVMAAVVANNVAELVRITS